MKEGATALLAGLVALVAPAGPAAADWWPAGWYGRDQVLGPGSYSDLDPMTLDSYWDTAAPAAVLSVGVVRIYQTVFSHFRTGACPFEPSCSRYGLRALGRYGPFWGWLMTVDRIFFRENEGIYRNYPRMEQGGWDKPYDPPQFDYLWEPIPWPLLPVPLEIDRP